MLQPDWIAYQIAKRFPILDDEYYQMRRWSNEFSLRKKKKNYQLHMDNKIKNQATEMAKSYVNNDLLNMMTPSKKGLFIYGSPANGKT